MVHSEILLDADTTKFNGTIGDFVGRYASPLLGFEVKLASPHVTPPVELRGNDITTLTALEIEFRKMIPEMQPMIMHLDRLTHIIHSGLME